MLDLSDKRIHTSNDQPSDIADINRKKQQSQQPRQLLSCTKCRERKVKCDRTKPCSACCARGAPKECHFIAEGGDYAPIQQSYELRKLRAENLRLKERLRASKIPIEDEDSDPAASPESQLGERPSSSQRRRAATQKRFQGSEWQDSIYFGSPGLASVIHDFASVNIDPSVTLAHIMPRGPDMYTPRNPPPHPFATLFKATPEECIPQLLSCLPLMEELLDYLDSFEKHANACSFPHVPVEVTKSEVERFLSDARKNAQMCPDMLALLFAAIALGSQHSVWDKSGGQWDADVMNTEMQKGNVYIAASMQALRLASFMHKPSLLGIQALIMIGPYLTNSGRFLDAWTLFGTTIRLAHSIGLHRHPKYLDPAPPTQRECSIRQTLWWWMLHMDEQYSMTLGRPLGISGIGDCPWPHELTTNPAMLRLGEFMHHFTVLARQILSSDRLTNGRIDELTDALRGLLETMPETLQFDESWNHKDTQIPEWPLSAMAVVYYCKTHSYLILLNRQRVEKHTVPQQMPTTKPSTPSFRTVNRTPSSHPSPTTSTKASLRGRALVLSSSENLISAFMFFYYKEPAALIDWTMGQQAFNSCMILLYDAIELRRPTIGTMKVEQAFVVFKELEDNDVHKLAGLAVERISWGLTELHKRSRLGSSMSVSTTHGQQGGHVETQGAAENEATRGSGPVDTVMGGTGMFLLEDPGLQAFGTEPFAPIEFPVPGFRSEYTKEQEHELPHRARQTRGTKSEVRNEDIYDLRSTEMQGTWRSTPVRPTPTRYTTPTAVFQPHGHPAPSPTGVATPHQISLGTATSGHQERQPSQRHHLVDSLHLLHTPSLELAPTGEPTSSNWEYEAPPGVTGRTLQHEDRPLTSADSQQGQLRQKSCPSLAQPVPGPPVLRPTYSSPSHGNRPTATHLSRNTPRKCLYPTSRENDQASPHIYRQPIAQSAASVGTPNVHPPFAARPAVPMSSIAETSPDFSSTNRGNHHVPGISQEMFREQQVVYPFAAPYANAGPSSLTPLTENMNLEEWRKYVGISHAG